MDKTPENNPSQNELEVGLNNQPIKKDVLEKAKGFFGRKEYNEPTPFHVRKEPTFGMENNSASAPKSISVGFQNRYESNENTNPIVENITATATSATTATAGNPRSINSDPIHQDQVHQVTEPVAQPQINIAEQQVNMEDPQINNVEQPVQQPEAQPIKTETEQPVTATQNRIKPEPITATRDSSDKPNMKNPENWAPMQKLPPKHRRLFIVLFLVVVALLALWLLKPNSETVNDFQSSQNGNSMPIEFQSLDPNKPVENSDNNNVNNAQEQTTQPRVQPQTDNPVQLGTESSSVNNNVPVTNVTPTEVTPTATNNSATTVPAMPATPVANKTEDDAEKLAQQKAQAEKARLQAEQRAKEQERLRQERAEQALKAKELEKAKAAEKARLEKMHAEQQAKEQAAKAEQARKAKEKSAVQIVDAKPAGEKTAPAVKGTSKTLTVPASTSLFQVFRDNNLDIRDVNAMTKANGVGNALSNFKAGDKIQVSLNSEGRVATMRLANGATFSRQADGSYHYSK